MTRPWLCFIELPDPSEVSTQTLRFYVLDTITKLRSRAHHPDAPSTRIEVNRNPYTNGTRFTLRELREEWEEGWRLNRIICTEDVDFHGSRVIVTKSSSELRSVTERIRRIAEEDIGV